MKRSIFLTAAMLILTTAIFAQPMFGTVEGVVTFPDGNPAPGAMVFLAGVNGGHGGHHPMFRVHTGPHGQFGIPRVPVGPYTISASHPFGGFAAELIEVLPQQTTNVSLQLARRDSVGRPHDSLTIVELSGTAIVEQPDPAHPRMVRYLLDVDGNGAADFLLSFGPPWYRSGEDNLRPQNGDRITVVGGLLTHTDRPVVVVFAINGEFWRDPRRGHGGHGGGDHGRRGCIPDSIVVVDLEGTAIVRTGEGFHGERTMYFIDTNRDTHPNFVLDFGAADYDPGNGAQRPVHGDDITIVGGLIFCPNAPEARIVIVYEINGLLWRVPGDTAGLGPMDPTAVGDPVVIGAPLSYLTARNFPNPFNPVTTIDYSIPMAGDVRVTVYDITGREVAELVNAYQNAGRYAVAWDGAQSASGIYFYRVNANNLTFTGRMVLMK